MDLDLETIPKEAKSLKCKDKLFLKKIFDTYTNYLFGPFLSTPSTSFHLHSFSNSWLVFLLFIVTNITLVCIEMHNNLNNLPRTLSVAYVYDQGRAPGNG